MFSCGAKILGTTVNERLNDSGAKVTYSGIPRKGKDNSFQKIPGLKPVKQLCISDYPGICSFNRLQIIKSSFYLSILLFMKLSLTIIACILSYLLPAQRYSSTIKDSMIVEFMNFMIPEDSSVIISNDIMFPGRIQKKDDLPVSGKYWAGVFTEYKLEHFLTEEDAVFFAQQMSNVVTPCKWSLPFGIFLKDEMVYFEPTLTRRYYTYSLPLFSKNSQYAVIQYSFSAGNTKGGSGYYLCEKQAVGSWKMIKLFGYRGE